MLADDDITHDLHNERYEVEEDGFRVLEGDEHLLMVVWKYKDAETYDIGAVGVGETGNNVEEHRRSGKDDGQQPDEEHDKRGSTTSTQDVSLDREHDGNVPGNIQHLIAVTFIYGLYQDSHLAKPSFPIIPEKPICKPIPN